MTTTHDEHSAVCAPAQSVLRRKSQGPTIFRNATSVSCAAVLVASALATQVFGAQPAHADQIVSANDLCSSYRPGYVVKLSVSSVLPMPICAAWNEWMPGINDNNDGRLVPGTFPGLPAGSHRVNPWDPYSAWVIPGCGGLECN